jgi:hypothetical protein
MTSPEDNELTVIAVERALGFDRTNPKSKRTLDRLMRPAHVWAESESIQKEMHHWTFEREYEAFALALRFQKDSLSRLMSERAKLPRPAVLGKFAKRDHCIRERYVQRKSRDQGYSVSRFCMDLDLGRIEVPPHLLAQLRGKDGQLLSQERFRQIIKAR